MKSDNSSTNPDQSSVFLTSDDARIPLCSLPGFFQKTAIFMRYASMDLKKFNLPFF
jgi:hypothetical protein